MSQALCGKTNKDGSPCKNDATKTGFCRPHSRGTGSKKLIVVRGRSPGMIFNQIDRLENKLACIIQDFVSLKKDKIFQIEDQHMSTLKAMLVQINEIKSKWKAVKNVNIGKV